ncbi:MAG: hypothetical protein K2N73_06710 [Lachnospiraceae bacterium]|nr:hypothetical protein [Lachnospiraceae bacterium]
MQVNMAGFNMGMHITADKISNNKASAGFINSINTGKQDAFGAQCRVTISHEGRRKSEQDKRPAAGNAMDRYMERILLREQEQAQEFKSEQSNTLNEISDLMKAIQNSYASGEDKETIQKKQDALNKMIDLKKRQEEENKQRVQDAMKGVSGGSSAQEEIDRKNEELLMLLKSFEEQEDEEGGTTSKKGDSGTARKEESAGEQLQESAAMLGVSAARRELETTGTIDELKNDGYSKLDEVNQIMREISAELDKAAEAASDESLSEEERRQLASDHVGMAQGLLVGNYGYMMDLRRKGLQEIKDARELEQKHIKVNPLDGVKQAKQAIMDASVDAAFQEEASGVLDKSSQELADKVQEAIDRRNDITSSPDKKTEEESEEKKAEEEKAEEEKAEKEAEEKEAEDGMLLQKYSILTN